MISSEAQVNLLAEWLKWVKQLELQMFAEKFALQQQNYFERSSAQNYFVKNLDHLRQSRAHQRTRSPS